MKKLLSLVLAVMMLLSMGMAASLADEPHTITIMHRWSGTNEAILKKVTDAFMASNPDIVVETIAMNAQYMDLLQAMLADAAAGNPLPDLFIGGYNLLNYIAEEMDPTPVEELAPSQEAFEAFRSRFEDNIWAMTDYNGVHAGIPYAMSNMILYYNKDIFAQAGLTDADVPATWDQVKEVALTVKEKTGLNGILIQVGDDWADLGLIYSAGGRLVSDDGKQVRIDDEGTIRAYEMWQDLYKSGAHPLMANSQMNGEFIAGTVAMYATTIMKLASYNNSCAFEFGVAPSPRFEGYELQLPAGGAAAIPFAKDQKDKDAVWRLLDYMFSQEGMSTFVETGYLNVIKDEVPTYPGQEVAYAQIPNAIGWANWPGGSVGLEIDAVFLTDRLEMLQTGLDVRETLTRLCQQFNDML